MVYIVAMNIESTHNMFESDMATDTFRCMKLDMPSESTKPLDQNGCKVRRGH